MPDWWQPKVDEKVYAIHGPVEQEEALLVIADNNCNKVEVRRPNGETFWGKYEWFAPIKEREEV